MTTNLLLLVCCFTGSAGLSAGSMQRQLGGYPTCSTIPGMGEVRIQIIPASDPSIVDSIIDLADANSKYLGFMPEQAMRQKADEGVVLAALNEHDQSLLGYVLFSRSMRRVKIIHMCVAAHARKCGVASALLAELRRRNLDMDGISLFCREDYPALEFWKRSNFRVIDLKRGRGQAETMLVHLWQSFGAQDLFTESELQKKSAALSVVIDANVFYALHGMAEDKRVSALAGDWLDDEVSFHITKELEVEIDRAEVEVRKRWIRFAKSYEILQAEAPLVPAIVSQLRAIIGGARVQDQSDYKHLEHTIRSKVRHFITMDDGVLRHADQLRREFNIEVMSPTGLIILLSELRDASQYEPAGLAGTRCVRAPVRYDELTHVIEQFHRISGLPRHELRTRFDVAFNENPDNKAWVLTNEHAEPAALILMDMRSPGRCKVPIFRVRDQRMAPTIARFAALHVVKETIANQQGGRITATEITDTDVPHDTQLALRDVGFRQTGATWTKINATTCLTPLEYSASLTEVAQREPDLKSVLTPLAGELELLADPAVSADAISAVEAALYPGFVDSDVNFSYIIPIQPRWAAPLFDEKDAANHLIPMDALIALAWQNAYYRSGNQSRIKAPSRVLWYVSKGEERQKGIMGIRAAAVIHESHTASAKEVFKRFSRLGVYRWKDVSTIADKSKDKVEAFRFGPTAVFPIDINRRVMSDVLREYGVRCSTIQSPVSVSAACFRCLYEFGFDYRS